ncbi:hypothetical protein [Streptomyces lavendofoliae]|uniref:Uncharacterized protein n=2 Tax=Streptomyces TaxID=1883 RepID=A0A918I3C9_9ACTN|nr:hypothetical protein [Streptomyces lavendofoliae]GGU62459.1 hypothetical protein GCM10010274_59060 [Streptomyces lavendofoliae]
MDQDRTPQDLAYAAADTIRELNHATKSVSAFHGEHGFRGAAPANLSSTVQGLITLTDRMPQSLQQLRRGLQQLEEEQQIRMADGTEPGEGVSTALRALLNAEEAIRAANHALRTAGAPMAAMGGYLDETLDEDDDAVV